MIFTLKILLLNFIFFYNFSTLHASEESAIEFYRGTKEPGFYLYMEKLTSKNEKFWWDYKKQQQSSIQDSQAWMSKKQTLLGEGKFSGGIQAFVPSSSTKDYSAWVAYISSKKIDTPNELKMPDIEMAVTVKTALEAPMVTHMGISRSFYYLIQHNKIKKHSELLKNLGVDEIFPSQQQAFISELEKKFEPEDTTNEIRIYFENLKNAKNSQEFEHILCEESPYKLHPNSAINLHSFAAKIILDLDPNKLYMITVPLPTMRDLLKEALPSHVYIDDSLGKYAHLRKDENDKLSPIHRTSHTTRILSKEGETIWTYDKNAETVQAGTNNFSQEESKNKFFWFITGYIPLSLHSNPFVTVNLEALAKATPVEDFVKLQ